MLAALGGFEIAAMAGVCLGGGAASNVPVVVDGFIATAAAVAAERIAPALFEHLFFAIARPREAMRSRSKHFGVRPILDLGMRLGEGTGAALAMNVIEAALDLFHEMATFESAGVSEKIAMSDDAARACEVLHRAPLASASSRFLPARSISAGASDEIVASCRCRVVSGRRFAIGAMFAGEDLVAGSPVRHAIRSRFCCALAMVCHRRGSSRRTRRYRRCARRGGRSRSRAGDYARQPDRHIRRDRDVLRSRAQDPRAARRMAGIAARRVASSRRCWRAGRWSR